MNESYDSKQLQNLLEMEKREEQQLLNVAQAKYQSYQRKDVISEYCSGLCLLYD
jgi:DNA-binding SARP family transcriptional activator